MAASYHCRQHSTDSVDQTHLWALHDRQGKSMPFTMLASNVLLLLIILVSILCAHLRLPQAFATAARHLQLEFPTPAFGTSRFADTVLFYELLLDFSHADCLTTGCALHCKVCSSINAGLAIREKSRGPFNIGSLTIYHQYRSFISGRLVPCPQHWEESQTVTHSDNPTPVQLKPTHPHKARFGCQPQSCRLLYDPDIL